LGAPALKRSSPRGAAALLLATLAACAPPRPQPPSPPSAAAAPTPSPTAADQAIPWRDWGPAAFDAARAERRPLLVVVSRRFAPRDDAAWAAIEMDAVAASSWAARTVLVRADVDENPELADFAELSATVLQQQRVFPMALLLTPEGVPLGVVADDAAVPRIQEMVDAHTPLPALRAAGSDALEAIRRAQQPSPRAAAPTRAAAEARVQALSGFRDAPLSSLLLLVEAADRLHSAAARAAADRVLEAWRTRAAGGRQRLWDAAWRLLLHARLAPGPTGPDAEAARAIVDRIDGEGLDDAGLFRSGTSDADGGTQVDRRVFTGANGVMIAALASSGVRLSRPADLARAVRAADALLVRLGPAAALRRGAEGDRSFGPARLEDYASVALGLLELHKATSDRRFLQQADAVVDAAVSALWDNAGGGFFLHAEPTAPLPVRVKSGYDGERPSGNALMAMLLDELGRQTGRSDRRELARRTVDAFAGDLARAPSGVDGLWAAALRVLPAPSAPAPTARPAAPAHVVRGGVTLDARPERGTLRRGERMEIVVDLTFAPGWTVTPHTARQRGEVPLSVALLEPELGAGVATHGESAAGGLTARVPLRAPVDAETGPRAVRLAVRFEACRTNGACEPPERVTLEVPVTVTP
jgi:hypothetical protein